MKDLHFSISFLNSQLIDVLSTKNTVPSDVVVNCQEYLRFVTGALDTWRQQYDTFALGKPREAIPFLIFAEQHRLIISLSIMWQMLSKAFDAMHHTLQGPHAAGHNLLRNKMLCAILSAYQIFSSSIGILEDYLISHSEAMHLQFEHEMKGRVTAQSSNYLTGKEDLAAALLSTKKTPLATLPSSVAPAMRLEETHSPFPEALDAAFSLHDSLVQHQGLGLLLGSLGKCNSLLESWLRFSTGNELVQLHGGLQREAEEDSSVTNKAQAWLRHDEIKLLTQAAVSVSARTICSWHDPLLIHAKVYMADNYQPRGAAVEYLIHPCPGSPLAHGDSLSN
jgi:hypothetical protein